MRRIINSYINILSLLTLVGFKVFTLVGCTVGANYELRSISITPAETIIKNGLSAQLTATGIYSNNTVIDLTSSVTWTSDNTSVVEVDASGLATSNSAGYSTISANIGSISANTTLTVTPNIYVAGYYNDGVNDVAAVWKDGTRTDLEGVPGANSCANGVYVSNDVVYAAGYYIPLGNALATVWTDGDKEDLNAPGMSAATGIYASANNFYAVGNYWDPFDPGTRPPATIWEKGGLRAELPNLNRDTAATGIFLSEGSTYVVGFFDDRPGPLRTISLWTDGIKTYDIAPVVTNSYYSTSVYVSESKVYISGYYSDGINDVAALWIDSVETVLPSPALNNAAANSVYVSDGSVYVAGYYNNGLVDVATVWKDGVKLYDLPTASTGQNARANSISIYNGTVYVAGYYDDGIAKIATLWQDGVRIDLSSVPGLNAEAKSIYLYTD